MTHASTAAWFFTALTVGCAATNPAVPNQPASGSATGRSSEPSPKPAPGADCTAIATGATKLRVCRELAYQGDSDEHVVKVVEPTTAQEHVLVKAKSTILEVCDPTWQGFATDIASTKYTDAGGGRIDVHVRYRRAQLETLSGDPACNAAREKADTRMLVDKLGEIRTLNVSFQCAEARCKAVDPSVAAKGIEEGWLELPEWR